MSVTSSTVGGVNVWQFSGAVTDAELKTAWAALVANGVYTINRAIYLDNTSDLTALSGGFLVNFGTQVNPAFVLHTGRDKTKSTFNNFTFLQSTGLSVGSRGAFVRTWNGSVLVEQGGGQGIDGVSQKGGGMIYGVAGNPGGGDPRYLNEMAIGSLDGATIYSQEFAEQELQPSIGSTAVLKGLSFEKCFGFPQVGTPAANVNVVVYRSTQNTQNATQYPVRQYPTGNRYASICYVDSYVTRNNADITTRLADYYGSSATNRVVTMVLNNYTRESWFGASKTAFSAMGNWNAANQFWGGVLKKLEFVDGAGGVVRAYDSRSTTVSQKSSFLESGSVDFLDASLAPTADVQGRISVVHVGALATGVGPNPTITRYTDQKMTFQKFGKRVTILVPDMTKGDNDLSAFLPVVVPDQPGLARDQTTIISSTTIDDFQQLLEELHVLAITLSGSDSYNAVFEGNLFDFSAGELITQFDAVTLDPAAAQKIAYNAATNSLTIRATSLGETATVTRWDNATGSVTPPVGEQVKGLYESDIGPNTRVRFTNLV